MINIAIGTASSYKLNAIKVALHKLDFDFHASNFAVESEVSEQPHGKGETKTGAINRAKNALKEANSADIGLGVEFGYEPDGDIFRMVCWAAIVTKDGKIYSEHSSSLELPQELKTALIEDRDISKLVEGYYQKFEECELDRSFKRYLTKRSVIAEAVINATMRYLLQGRFY